MNEFVKMKEKLAANFEEKLGEKMLFEVDVDKDILWNLYLDSFPEGSNPIYRKRREHDCSCCRQFIKNIGGTVFIDEDLNIHSIFEFDTESGIYQPVMNALDTYIKRRSIIGVYFNDSQSVGCDRNYEQAEDGSVITWNHFYLNLPNQLVMKRSDIPSKKGELRDIRNVFKRSLDEISMEAIDIVIELIQSNTLYRGKEWESNIKSFKEYKTQYELLSDDKKDIYAWSMFTKAGSVIGKIRNHSIGVLLVDISNGKDLDESVRRYESIVAPSNYKRPKAIYTKKMLEDAKRTVVDLGYIDSLPRRYATLDDITVNNILFSNRDSAKRVSGNVFDDMESDIPVLAKKFSRVDEISIDTFVNDILPTAKEVEVLLENRHASNMVSLIAPVNKEAPSMFKWNNPFSWAYSGNITDSDIRERVKNAGGKVDGVLRFSIQWNDIPGEHDRNDLDAHCIEPNGARIYFGSMRSRFTGGRLDVDNRLPLINVPAVENITWPNKNKMIPGKYQFMVNQYFNRGGRNGFRAEIEFDGQIYRYDYPNELRQDDIIKVATVTLGKDGNFTIEHHLTSDMSTHEIWRLKSNTFVPVSVIMNSPNYWDEQSGIGHKHYFFMLKGCTNPENPNGFFNEYLKHDLEQHKRVFEALGSKMSVESTEDQLSGLGFSSTKRNELIVKVKGASERVMKIKF